jgi:hypothetical protein
LKCCRCGAPRALDFSAMSKPLVLMVDDDAELSGMVGELLERDG